MNFTPDDIRKRVRRNQFRPFRLVTSTNQQYDIYHPDLVMYGRNFLMIGVPTTDDPGLADEIVRIAFAHICELRDLAVPTPPTPTPEQTTAS